MAKCPKHRVVVVGLCLLAVSALVLAAVGAVKAGPFSVWHSRKDGCGPACKGDGPPWEEVGGTWYWLRSPEEEKRVVQGLFNRLCIRCHMADGRGAWDIPGIPDFSNARWQAFHTDGQLARSILEGRGAVMPPFRGALSLEEAWAMARHLRTFVPGTETPRPDYGSPSKGPATPK
jgi:hypothetical protein